MSYIEQDLQRGVEIRALSWKEPYGTLMLHGKIETRSWQTSYRGLVLICTSRKEYTVDEVCSISYGNMFSRIAHMIAKNEIIPDPGKAIAVGRLIDCRVMRPTDEEKCFVKYHSTLWCHVYADVVPIEHISWIGGLRWRKVGSDVVSSIKFM
jgi:hypothetical protein